MVKEIFSLCMQGYGPTQIARILTERKIDTPTVYNRNHGLPATSLQMQSPNIWNTEAVKRILENLSYCGHTVNFTTTRKSYKSKKKVWLPREEWVVFKNTHEAIIDEETYETVQRIRQAKRRPTRMGEMSVFSGLVCCADCGKKMYLCRCSKSKQKDYFNCSTYRKKTKHLCTSHRDHRGSRRTSCLYGFAEDTRRGESERKTIRGNAFFRTEQRDEKRR